MKSSEDICRLYADRRKAAAELQGRMKALEDVVYGRLALPTTELTPGDKAAVPNLIARGLTQLAMRVASTQPTPVFPPLRPGIKLSEDRARDRRDVTLGWWAKGDLNLLRRKRARHLLGYATTPVQMRVNFSERRPEWMPRSPRESLPAPCSGLVPEDCIFAYSRTSSWVRSAYPDSLAFLTRSDFGTPRPDTKVRVIEYVSAEQVTILATGTTTDDESVTAIESGWSDRWSFANANGNRTDWAVKLVEYPNRADRPLVVAPWSIDLADPSGVFDQSLGLYLAQARLMALEELAIQGGIFPEPWLEPHPNSATSPEIIAQANGRTGEVGIVKGGTLNFRKVEPGFAALQAIDRYERAIRMNSGIPAEFGGECVDAETEILTDQGWKHHDEVAVGTSVLTLNPMSGLSEWQRVQKVNIFPAAQRDMVEMEGPRHSSLTTLNHRWLLRNWRDHWDWRVSPGISSHDRIPIAATCADLPTEPKWSFTLVELVAWFYTEGSSRPSGGQISQSLDKNPENVERIRHALMGLFGQPTQDWRNLSGCGQGGVGHDGVPRWNESAVASNGVVKFNLSAHAVRALEEHAPGKVPTHEFLLSLTADQLDLFLRVSMLADNCGPDRFGQKDSARADAFAFAAILSGQAVSYRHRVKTEARPGWRAGEYEAFVVRLRKRRFVKPKESADVGASSFTVIRHDGLVWCPTTTNGTWFARRKGSVYFTGNSASNVRTGRRGDSIMSATVDHDVHEAQEILAASQHEEDQIAIAIDRKYFRGSKPVNVSWTGAKTARRYETANTWELDDEAPGSLNVDHFVQYSVPGSDINGVTVQIGQLLGTGLISQQSAREKHPFIDDAEQEKDRTTAEGIHAALLSQIQTLASTPEGPFQPIDLARLAELVLTGKEELYRAVQIVNEEAQKRQASAGPVGAPDGPVLPGSPEAQPGLAMAGQGAEAPAVIPDPGPSQDNLAQLLNQLRGARSSANAA